MTIVGPETTAEPEIAYYYPEWHWQPEEHSWIKTMLLFFDEIALLVPDYKRQEPSRRDPALAGALQDEGLLRIIEPEWFVDEQMTVDLAEWMVGLIEDGSFDHLSRDDRFDELSMSRAGYSGYYDEAERVVAMLRERNLATETRDGLSIPMHPEVRSTYLMLLAQLACQSGRRRGLDLHPTTNQAAARGALTRTLNLPGMPTRGRVIDLDLQAVSVDVDNVPLDELLAFRNEFRDEHRRYMEDLRRFTRDLSAIDNDFDRDRALQARQAELHDSAEALKHRTWKALKQPKNAIGLTLGIVGAGIGLATHSPLPAVGVSLSGQLVTRLFPDKAEPSMYSYLFSAQKKWT